jgi:hypothetical protein
MWDQAIIPLNRFSSANFTKIPENFNTEPGLVYGVEARAAQAAYVGIQNNLFGTVNLSNQGEIAYIGSSGGNLDGLKGLWYAADDIDGWMGNLTKLIQQRTAYRDDKAAQHHLIRWSGMGRGSVHRSAVAVNGLPMGIGVDVYLLLADHHRGEQETEALEE